MFGTALYHPFIDIRDPVWLRSAMLFWDEIQTIAPSSISEPYRTDDSRRCAEEGYLKPLRCDLHMDVLDELGRHLAKLLDRRRDENWLYSEASERNKLLVRPSQRDEWLQRRYAESGRIGLSPNKMSAEALLEFTKFGLFRIHGDKLDPSIRRMFRDYESGRIHRDKLSWFLREHYNHELFQTDEDGEWLMIDPEFADGYMAAMASRLGEDLGFSPLTDSPMAHNLSSRMIASQLVDDSRSHASGALVAVAMEGLRVDASTPIDRLLRFRRQRSQQLYELSERFSGLVSEIANNNDVNSDGRDLHERARQIYNRDIAPELRKLRRELEHNDISSVWDGVYRAVTISVPSAGALNYFTGLAGPALLGAGAALALTDIGVRSYLAARKAKAASPFSYLYDASAEFGLPSLAD